MSERKYRQRGYQDEPREPRERPASAPRPAPEPGAPAGARRLNAAPKTPQLPGFHDVVRCARCGDVLAAAAIGIEAQCARCGTDLHTCAQCAFFDPGSRFECTAAVTARIAPKDARNACRAFAPRTTVERQVTTPRVDTARQAFDDLFRF